MPSDWVLAALEHAPAAVMVADLDGSIRYVNPAFERGTGLSSAALLGRDVRCLAAHGQAAAAINGLRRAFRRGEPWCGELTTQRSDGSPLSAKAGAHPIRDQAGVLVASVTTIHDTSNQRAIEGRGVSGVSEARLPRS